MKLLRDGGVIMSLSLDDIKKWEKHFAKRRGFHPTNKEEAEQRIGRILLHLQEELGEASRAYRKKEYRNLLEELSDMLLFIAKISNMLDDYYDIPSFEEILKRKMEYNERRFPIPTR